MKTKAFTLLELLVVITILGIVAALSVTALKGINSAGNIHSASFQLRQDINHTRQLAMSTGRNTFIVFPATTNVTLFNHSSTVSVGDTYAIMMKGSSVDQPGNHPWRMVTDWKQIQEHFAIHPLKMSGASFEIPSWNSSTIYGLPLVTVDTHYAQPVVIGSVTNYVEHSETNNFYAIGFDYKGRLLTGKNEVVPVVQIGVDDKVMSKSTNSGYSIVTVDGQTGLTRVEEQKVK